MKFTAFSHIALDTLQRVESKYPHIWRSADDLQQKFSRGRHLDGSVFSYAEAQALSLKLQHREEQQFHPALLGALVAWRPSKGIYRFHPELYEALIQTEMEGEIPSHLLMRMPSWAVFIETPLSENLPFQLEGFWAYLSRLGKQNELILAGLWRKEQLHFEAEYNPDWDILLYDLPIGSHPVSDLTELMYQQYERESDQENTRSKDMMAIQNSMVSSMLSLLLYLCSEKPDIANWNPEKPAFKFLGGKRRLISSKTIHQWDVGLRIGAALKKARERADGEANQQTSNSTTLRPHVRRAHWHSYWVGKRGEQTLSLRWLPPIPINVDEIDELPAVIRSVE